MSQGKLFPITTQPGIKRDGTIFSGNYYIDGEWCRFQRGLPRKMGGYFQFATTPRKPYGTYVVPNTPNFDVYIGDNQSLQFQKIDQFNNPIGGLVDRTPAGFAASPDNVWQFCQNYLNANANSNLIVHAGQNLSQIDNIVNSPVYFGPTNAITPLVPFIANTGPVSVSGGVTAMNPFIVTYGNFGQVSIYDNAAIPNRVENNFVCSQKIVSGFPLRGTSQGPACLLFSLDAVVRVVSTGNAAIPFSFYTVSSENSIISSRSAIEYDGIFYWAGIDRFLFYNGTVQELPNQMNLDYFFQNLNYAQRQKIWSTKVPEFGEIHWHVPLFGATECNHIIIYNKRENTWYDTPYPFSPSYPNTLQGRGSGYFEQVFADPIWTDNLPNNGGTYSLWVHETAYDENVNGNFNAIPSLFTTGDIGWAALGPTGSWTGVDRWIDLERIEPDFWQQTGNMQFQIFGYEYAAGTTPPVNPALPDSIYNPYTFTPTQKKIDMREQARYMFLQFSSDTVGGFYELGQLLAWFRVGDARP